MLVPTKVVMVADDIDQASLHALQRAFDDVREVALMDSQDEANLALLDRPELGVTFTKLNCWKLTEYSKCVFLDADTMVSTCLLKATTGILNQIRTKLHDWAGWQTKAGCYSQAVLSSNDSKTLYTNQMYHNGQI